MIQRFEEVLPIGQVDFATFCYEKDAHRLHAPGQLEKQIKSNNYPFNKIFVVYQSFSISNRLNETFYSQSINGVPIYIIWVDSDVVDKALVGNGIDIDKPQYQSPTDKHHRWQVHVVNHLVAAYYSYDLSKSDFIVFADNDCWIIKQPDSWIKRGIDILQQNPDVFIVSPNDGEPARKTQVMSQQMFMVRTEDFRQADFNQPGWDGDVHVPGGPFPEYWALLEGRMELYCRYVNRYRYVLPPEYRYWHFNRTTQGGQLETDLGKY